MSQDSLKFENLVAFSFLNLNPTCAFVSLWSHRCTALNNHNQTRLSSSNRTRFDLFSPLNSLVLYLLMMHFNKWICQSFNLIRLWVILMCNWITRRHCRSIEDTLTPISSSVLCVSLSSLLYRLVVRLVMQSHRGP